jgi:hypothetical protein
MEARGSEAPPRPAQAIASTVPSCGSKGSCGATSGPHCFLTGITHDELGPRALLLIGPKEAVELGLVPSHAPQDLWLCAWDYAELRFNKPSQTIIEDVVV